MKERKRKREAKKHVLSDVWEFLLWNIIISSFEELRGLLSKNFRSKTNLTDSLFFYN